VKVRRAVAETRQRLEAAGCESPEVEAEILVAHLLGVARSEIAPLMSATVMIANIIWNAMNTYVGMPVPLGRSAVTPQTSRDRRAQISTAASNRSMRSSLVSQSSGSRLPATLHSTSCQRDTIWKPEVRAVSTQSACARASQTRQSRWSLRWYSANPCRRRCGPCTPTRRNPYARTIGRSRASARSNAPSSTSPPCRPAAVPPVTRAIPSARSRASIP